MADSGINKLTNLSRTFRYSGLIYLVPDFVEISLHRDLWHVVLCLSEPRLSCRMCRCVRVFGISWRSIFIASFVCFDTQSIVVI